jgi:O-antigen/teichoic acid export membrane protein
MVADTAIPPPTPVSQRIASGAGWMILLRLSDRLLGILSFSILARLLVPEHFGLVALAGSLIGFVELFTEMSVEVALVRDPQIDRRLYATAWTLKIIRAVALGILFVLLAKPVAWFFDEARLEAVIYALALAGLLQAVENIGVIDFRKLLAFDKEFQYVFLTRILSFPIAILMAYQWRSYWALIGGMLAQRAIQAGLSYIVHSYRPTFSLEGMQTLLHISKWMALQNCAYGFRMRAPAVVLGRLANVTAVGYFDVAYEMASLATSELRAPIARVLLPGFATLSTDPDRMKRGFLDAYGVLVLLGLPIPITMALCAPSIVRILLGDHWLPAVPVIQILALYGVIQVFGTNSHVIYMTLNKLKLMTGLSVMHLGILLPCLIGGVWWNGAIGAGWALTITAAVVLIINMFLAVRVLSLHLSDFGRSIVRPALAGGGMSLMLWGLIAYTPPAHGMALELLSLVLMGTAGLTTYLGLILSLWILWGRPEGAERRILTMAKAQWDSLRSRISTTVPTV